MADPTALESAYRDHLAKHLPQGSCWAKASESTLQKLLLGMAGEFARVHGRILDLTREGDPRMAFELLPDWEEFLGLPDPCQTDLGDIQARRDQVVALLLEGRVPTPASFIELASDLGYEIEIHEHRQFEVGRSTVGERLTNWGDPFLVGFNTVGQPLGPVLGWPFYWDVCSEQFTVRRFTVGGSTVGQALASWGNGLLECVIRRAAPAHTIPRFLYRTLIAELPISWGINLQGQTNIPVLPSGVTWTKIATGARGSIGLRSDGVVECWGSNVFGEGTVPGSFAAPVVDVARGEYTSLALLADGTIVTWPASAVPALPGGVLYTAMAAGDQHFLALRSDGSAIGWGASASGQIAVPALTGSLTYVQVACGSAWSLLLRSDGQLFAIGNNTYGQTTLPSFGIYTPVKVSCASPINSSIERHGLALLTNGSIVGWGSNGQGQLNVPALPSGLLYTDVAAGGYFSMALRSDGIVVCWGSDGFGQVSTIPALPPGMYYSAVHAGFYHALAERASGTDC